MQAIVVHVVVERRRGRRRRPRRGAVRVANVGPAVVAGGAAAVLGPAANAPGQAGADHDGRPAGALGVLAVQQVAVPGRIVQALRAVGVVERAAGRRHMRPLVGAAVRPAAAAKDAGRVRRRLVDEARPARLVDVVGDIAGAAPRVLAEPAAVQHGRVRVLRLAGAADAAQALAEHRPAVRGAVHRALVEHLVAVRRVHQRLAQVGGAAARRLVVLEQRLGRPAERRPVRAVQRDARVQGRVPDGGIAGGSRRSLVLDDVARRAGQQGASVEVGRQRPAVRPGAAGAAEAGNANLGRVERVLRHVGAVVRLRPVLVGRLGDVPVGAGAEPAVEHVGRRLLPVACRPAVRQDDVPDGRVLQHDGDDEYDDPYELCQVPHAARNGDRIQV